MYLQEGECYFLLSPGRIKKTLNGGKPQLDKEGWINRSVGMSQKKPAFKRVLVLALDLTQVFSRSVEAFGKHVFW